MPRNHSKYARAVGYTAKKDSFNAGVFGVNVERAVSLDVPGRLNELFRIHHEVEELWDNRSLNQAAFVLLAVNKTKHLDHTWNCKYQVSTECSIYHYKPSAWYKVKEDARARRRVYSCCGNVGYLGCNAKTFSNRVDGAGTRSKDSWLNT